MRRTRRIKKKRKTIKSRKNIKTGKTKRYRTIKGGFFSDANYFIQKGISFMSVDPTAPIGNTSLPVPPFPYFQDK